jgi:aryl-phospho-beta-D-glucosidase BglC (GH1 family)
LGRAATTGFLHTQGQGIVDEKGQNVLLRGVGLGNWMLPEGYMWKFGEQGDRPRKIEKLIGDLIGPESAARFWTEYRKNYITEADVKRIAELGFNSVRPALNARLFLSEGKESTYLKEGFDLLDNLVGWCKTHGLYVIIDMHAAPGGQTGANIDDSAKDLPELFTDSKNQDRLVALWVKIAERYKAEPTVAAYDLLNEPLPERTGAAAKYKTQLEPLYKRITKAIREVDPRHMITVEGADWSNEWSVFSKPFDSNMVYQLHYYCWDKPAKLKTIGEFLRYRRKLKAPIWVGETGERDNVIYWGTTDYFESVNVGWSFWPWKKMETRNTPYSIKAPEDWEKIAAYSRGQDKPTKEIAQKALDQLLKNIKLENCVYFPDVVNALFHLVPGRVEAENYGHEGENKSYFVKNALENSKYFRTLEPVSVQVIEAAGDRWLTEQGIKLSADEWATYPINSAEAKTCDVTVKVKAGSTPAVFQVSINDQTQELNVTQTSWTQIPLKPASLLKGANRLKVLVKQGTVSFDWFDFH